MFWNVDNANENIINPKSANLKIVNTTIGVKNLVPSQISWLNTGEKFVSFNCMDKQIALKWKSQILILRKTAINAYYSNYNHYLRYNMFGCVIINLNSKYLLI